MKIIGCCIISILSVSCQFGSTENGLDSTKSTRSIEDNSWLKSAPATGELQLAEGFTYKILFSEGDKVLTTDGKKVRSKGNNDAMVFFPKEGKTNEGILYIGHETKEINPDLGDGGGATVLKVKYKKGKWKVIGKPKNVDFSTVGYTANNCGGDKTPMGTMLTAEEIYPTSNRDIIKYISDTTDRNGLRAYQNFGWLTEVDPVTRKALRKCYAMGRFAHEDAYVTPDGKTVYMTMDETPAVLFKFEPHEANDFTSGRLYAFKDDSLNGGSWVEQPDGMEYRLNAKQVAIESGASLFLRHEWITRVGDKLYITETGADSVNFDYYTDQGAKLPWYFRDKKVNGERYSDPFGRVLELDMNSNIIKPYLEGYGSFSNPDCIEQFKWNGQQFLLLNEDIIGGTLDRTFEGTWTNEIYFKNMDEEGELLRFMIAPNGAETTGSCFSPDGKHLFVNIQHPSKDNPPPFNKSTTIVISGF